MPVFQSGYLQVIRDTILYAIQSQSSQQNNYSSAQVQAWELWADVWKTIDRAQSYVIGDCTVAKVLNGFGLFNVNYPQVNIQFHSTTDFTTPAVETGLIAINKNPLTERYNLLINPLDYGAVNHRYFRVLIPAAQTTTDGEDFYITGGIAATDSLEDFMFDVNYGLEISADKPEEVIRMRGGRDEVWDLGDERLAEITMNFNSAREVTEFEQVMAKLFTIDGNTPIILGFNQALYEQAGKKNWVLPLKRQPGTRPRLTIQSFGMNVVNEVSMRETK